MTTAASVSAEQAGREANVIRPTPQFTRLVVMGTLMVLAAIFLAPFFWMISTSFKTTAQSVASPPVLVPDPFVWANYPDALIRMNFIRSLANS